MSSRNVPAAAVPIGATVMAPFGTGLIEIIVSDKESGLPRPGLITWWDETSHDYVVGGAQEVEVLNWPPRKEHPS